VRIRQPGSRIPAIERRRGNGAAECPFGRGARDPLCKVDAGESIACASGIDGLDRRRRHADLGAVHERDGAVGACLAGGHSGATAVRAPYDVRGIFAAARDGDPVGRAVVEEEARRIALHIAPISAVTDIALVVLGGGIGVNADLLLDPIRDLLTRWLPYPPRVEVSSLGDAAVLTGALAVGLRSAVDNVFANRRQLRA
jgi:hypothetical protein